MAKMATTEDELRNEVMYEIRTNPLVPNQMVATITTLADDDYRKTKKDTIRKRTVRFLIIYKNLFKKGYNVSYLKYLGLVKPHDSLREIHEGICGNHIGSRTLAHNAIRQGYYWPIMK